MIALVGLRPPASYYVTPRELQALVRAHELESKILWQHIRSAFHSEATSYERAMGMTKSIERQDWKAIKERHGWN